MSQFFIGIDGGGSKTAAVVVDESMAVLGEGRAGPSNHLRVGIDVARVEIERATLQALAAAGLAIREIEYAYCGIAGSEHPRHRKSVVESLESLFQGPQFTVDSDARIALTAGVGFGAGVSIIAGTGSVAFGRDSNGREARAGGWGPTLGDEGSGYSIARRGLSAIVRAHDGRGARTQITELLCGHHGMCKAEDLPFFVYAPSTHVDDIALYCRIVFEAAQNGDDVAKEILSSEGEELGRTVAAVARTLALQDQPFPVAYAGGAFAGGELLLEPMRRVVHAAAPLATIGPARERPVLGAARMAIDASHRRRPERV